MTSGLAVGAAAAGAIQGKLSTGILDPIRFR
jgi:hypothetical protein